MATNSRNSPETEALAQLGDIGIGKVKDKIKKDLQQLRVEFDVWFREQSLYENGQYEKVMGLLRKGGYLGRKRRRDLVRFHQFRRRQG